MKRRAPYECRVDCKCADCGGVKLHMAKRPARRAPDPAVLALDAALRSMVQRQSKGA
jgi:hypothetical protein